MKQIIFFISTLILCTGCTTKSEKAQTESQTKPQVENSKTQVESIPAKELENLIKIPIRDKFDEKYGGYYSYTTNPTGNKVLNGDFKFTYFDSSAMYNQALDEYDSTWITMSKIEYSGTFEDGTKEGTFTEKLLFDDGVDLYSKWTVSLEYKEDNCSSGTFTGIFGYIMEETTYRFDQLETCTFQSVVEKASERWTEEYEKRKN